MQTSSSAAAGTDELSATIDEVVAWQLQAAELKAKIDAGKAKALAIMKALGVERFITNEKNEAKYWPVTKRDWDVDMLEVNLGKTRFEALCPRTPDTKALGKILEADPILKPILEKCCRIEMSESMSIRPAPKDKDDSGDPEAELTRQAPQVNRLPGKKRVKGDPPNLLFGKD